MSARACVSAVGWLTSPSYAEVRAALLSLTGQRQRAAPLHPKWKIQHNRYHLQHDKLDEQAILVKVPVIGDKQLVKIELRADQWLVMKTHAILLGRT